MSNVRNQVLSQVKSQLEGRGIRFSLTDVATWLEDVSPRASRAALSYAVDFIRPFAAGMGLRISRFTDTRIELVIPARARNLNDNKELHDAALLASALEAARLLWERHAPLGDFRIQSTQSQLQLFKHCQSEVRLRLELPENLRESVLAQLRKNRAATLEMFAQVYDDMDQTVAEIQLHLELSHSPRLSSKQI